MSGAQVDGLEQSQDSILFPILGLSKVECREKSSLGLNAARAVQKTKLNVH